MPRQMAQAEAQLQMLSFKGENMPFFEPGNFTAGGLLGIILGTFLGDALAKRRGDRDRNLKAFNESAQSLREAFEPEFISSQSSQSFSCDFYYLLKESFWRHENAVIAFKKNLNPGDIKKFEKAWEEYCYPDGDPDGAPEPLVDYISDSNEDVDREKRHLAHVKIQGLLDLASPK